MFLVKIKHKKIKLLLHHILCALNDYPKLHKLTLSESIKNINQFLGKIYQILAYIPESITANFAVNIFIWMP